MSEHRFHCTHCLDRGYTIEEGFSPSMESRAEFVPCPVCRPEPAPRRRSWQEWALLALIVLLFLMAFLRVRGN